MAKAAGAVSIGITWYPSILCDAAITAAAQYVRANPNDGACEFSVMVVEVWRGCELARGLLRGLPHRARRVNHLAMVVLS